MTTTAETDCPFLDLSTVRWDVLEGMRHRKDIEIDYHREGEADPLDPEDDGREDPKPKLELRCKTCGRKHRLRLICGYCRGLVKLLRAGWSRQAIQRGDHLRHLLP